MPANSCGWFYKIAFALFFIVSVVAFGASEAVADGSSSGGGDDAVVTLDTIRESLIREEDTIIYSLIERAKYPINSKAYEAAPAAEASGKAAAAGARLQSLAEFVIRDVEAVQAMAGRYENPAEIPFFPETLPSPSFTPYNFSEFLYPRAASVNVSNTIWDIYFRELLPLFVAQGDDGNYAASAASDLACLQALSRRIHIGKFVAEIKFRSAPDDYEPPIRAKDTDTLMKLLTDVKVEEMVKKRVEKKARVFGQYVGLGTSNSTQLDDGEAADVKYKVDPSVVLRLYDEWLIPLTKDIEVQYLLRRLP